MFDRQGREENDDTMVDLRYVKGEGWVPVNSEIEKTRDKKGSKETVVDEEPELKLEFQDDDDPHAYDKTVMSRRSPRVEKVTRTDDEEEEPIEEANLSLVQQTARKKIQKLFDAAHDVDRSSPQDVEKIYKATKELKGYILDVVEGAEASSAKKDFLKKQLGALIEEEHRRYMEEREDISDDQKKLLLTPQGRIRFRITVFNNLCDQSLYGLSPKKRIKKAHKTEAELDAFVRTSMKKSYAAFDRACSKFDGRTVLRTLEGFASDIAKSPAVAEYELTAEKLASERKKILARHDKRVAQEMKPNYVALEERGKWTKFLEAGGDIALKGAAVGLLYGSGLGWFTGAGAVALWGARGFTNAMGRDFGQSLGNLLKRPFAETPRKADTLSLSFTERLKALGRGFMPIPAVLEKVGLGKFVPENVTEDAPRSSERHVVEEEEMNAACEEALKTLVSKAKSPPKKAKAA